jgi:hypothetical protein
MYKIKVLIWHIQGGLGKNVAATALIPDLKKHILEENS